MNQDLAQAMRSGMRRLASGVSILTTHSPAGVDLAMTVSSVTSVSDDPPSLLVCVARTTRICPLLTPGHEFAINVLAQHHQAASNLCATGDQGPHRFDGCNWQRASGKAPVLADAEAVFVCQVDAVQLYGSHHVVIGRILQASAAPTEPNPLIYLNGGYHRLA